MTYTPDDIQRLAKFIRVSRDARPFSLLTGAGCSKSAGIPLASKLIDEIVSSDRFAPHISALSSEDRKSYGKLMACLGRNERKDLLGPYLSKAKVNWAHIAIAAMMSAGYIGRVCTFNFDNVLARACGICGLYPATYDFVTGVSHSTDHIVTPSIIHLHGQGYGLSMLNSEEETAKHAERLRPLIRDTLSSSPLLVVGYSGLSDAVFPVIKEEFKGDERLFWAGYSDTASGEVTELLKKHNQLTSFLGGADADLFLVELAQALGCWPPVLFSDPIAHLRKEIEPITSFPIAGKEAEAVDVLAALQQRLEQLENDPTIDTPDLRAMVQVLKGDFDAVIEAKESGQNIPDNLYIAALINKGVALATDAETDDDPALFDAAGEKYRAALDIKPDYHKALNNWGLALAGKARATGDAALFDEAGGKYKAALDIKPDKHEALSNWGNALAGKAEATGDATLFDEAGGKYKAALDIKPDDHEVLNNWGVAMAGKAEATGNPALFDKAAKKFEAALDIKPNDHDALSNWGCALLKKGKATGISAHLDAALKKLEKSAEIQLGNVYNLACAHALKGDLQEARHYLEICLAEDTLPGRAHLEADDDLDGLRNADWFKAIVASAK